MQLEAWHDFHVIAGGSAAALVGLIFVVISIGPRAQTRRAEDIRAFVSPTVACFATVLLLSSLMVMPQVPPWLRGAAVATLGLAGALRALIAHVPSRRRHHKLGREDLASYFVIPLVAYLGIVVAGVLVILASHSGPTIVGTAILVLLAIGLRNAWDLVLFTARKAAE